MTVTVNDDYVDTLGWTTDPELASQVLAVAQRVCEIIRTGPEVCPASTTRAIELALDTERTRQIQELKDERLVLEGERSKLASALANAQRVNEVECCKKEYELETAVREACVERDATISALQTEHAELRRAHDQLTSGLTEQIERARMEEQRAATRKHEEQLTRLSTQNQTAHEEIMTLERSLSAKAIEVGELRDTFSGQVAALKERIVELETPMGRGRAGETDVAATLQNVGFLVEDTSMGEAKDKGYLDLLVRPEGSEDSNMRIAIEMKNVKTVQKQDRDDFERKVHAGIRNNLFDAAIFISIRAHTKAGGPMVLELYPDEGRRPLVPVAWLGPERSKQVVPISAEQVETALFMMSGLLHQTHMLRRELCSGLRDDDVGSMQTLVDLLGQHFSDTFTDLAKQSKLIDDLRGNLTQIRARAITTFSQLWTTNLETPWLGRTMNAPWMDAFQTARQKSDDNVSEATIWNQLSKNKSVVERNIGKEALFLALRKRKRVTEDEEGE